MDRPQLHGFEKKLGEKRTIPFSSYLPIRSGSIHILKQRSRMREQINMFNISRINPPKFGGGLKFESDADIGKKDSFRSSTI
jgi:hypothetical protein